MNNKEDYILEFKFYDENHEGQWRTSSWFFKDEVAAISTAKRWLGLDGKIPAYPYMRNVKYLYKGEIAKEFKVCCPGCELCKESI